MMSKKKKTTSQSIAKAVLAVDAIATFAVLALCALAILRDFGGALPYLTTLIGAMQAVTGVVLTAYYKKATIENSKGGIVYDTAVKNETEDETV